MHGMLYSGIELGINSRYILKFMLMVYIGHQLCPAVINEISCLVMYILSHDNDTALLQCKYNALGEVGKLYIKTVFIGNIARPPLFPTS